MQPARPRRLPGRHDRRGRYLPGRHDRRGRYLPGRFGCCASRFGRQNARRPALRPPQPGIFRHSVLFLFRPFKISLFTTASKAGLTAGFLSLQWCKQGQIEKPTFNGAF